MEWNLLQGNNCVWVPLKLALEIGQKIHAFAVIVKWKNRPEEDFSQKIDGLLIVFRSSHQRCSVKKGVLRSFAKFTGKHLCAETLSHRCFPVNFVKFLRTPFLQNTPERLLLCITNFK